MMGGALRDRLDEIARQADQEYSVRTHYAPRPQPEPLSKQIDRWLAETPPAVIDRPWTMAELQKIFVGRYRQRPHAQNVASELRKRGWYSRRTWTYPGYGQRLWFAPDLSTT